MNELLAWSVFSDPLTFAIQFVLAMLSLALVLAFIRLSRGPSLPDRVIALELIGFLSAGLITIRAIANHQPIFLDVAIVLSLVSFLGTVAFAHYLLRGGL